MVNSTPNPRSNAHDLAAANRLVTLAQGQAQTKFPYLAGQLERLYALGAAGSILELMEATWTNQGEVGEPYNEPAAVEIAVNELIDYARNRGCRVTYNNEEIGSPYGVCVHPPEPAEEGDGHD
jgi:hypothetical protein